MGLEINTSTTGRAKVHELIRRKLDYSPADFSADAGIRSVPVVFKMKGTHDPHPTDAPPSPDHVFVTGDHEAHGFPSGQVGERHNCTYSTLSFCNVISVPLPLFADGDPG